MSPSSTSGAVAFWYPQGAEEMNMVTGDVLGRLSGYPLDFADHAVKGILLTALPAGFMWPGFVAVLPRIGYRSIVTADIASSSATVAL